MLHLISRGDTLKSYRMSLGKNLKAPNNTKATCVPPEVLLDRLA